jgi:hypothetical protein
MNFNFYKIKPIFYTSNYNDFNIILRVNNFKNAYLSKDNKTLKNLNKVLNESLLSNIEEDFHLSTILNFLWEKRWINCFPFQNVFKNSVIFSFYIYIIY